jgi:hypothetical protein
MCIKYFLKEHNYIRGTVSCIPVFSSKTDYFKYSFFPHTVPIWNSLPDPEAEAPDLASFRQALKILSF